MLKAVAQGKAHWLFDRRITHDNNLKRRPQEDLVTSAVFGSLSLLEEAPKREALKLLLGDKVWRELNLSGDEQARIELWPQGMTAYGKRVEPDVVLHAGSQVMIVEVKWYAPLPDDQLDKEIKAVGNFYPRKKITGVLLLGDSILPSNFNPDGIPSDARTWRDVARDVARASRRPVGPFEQWADMLMGFLRKTEFGRVFVGFDELRFRPVEPSCYRFKDAGSPPWFTRGFTMIKNTHYEWKGK